MHIFYIQKNKFEAIWIWNSRSSKSLRRLVALIMTDGISLWNFIHYEISQRAARKQLEIKSQKIATLQYITWNKWEIEHKKKFWGADRICFFFSLVTYAFLFCSTANAIKRARDKTNQSIESEGAVLIANPLLVFVFFFVVAIVSERQKKWNKYKKN